MIVFNFGIALLLGTFLVGGAFGCRTTVIGATWEFEWGSDEEIPGIQTVDKCIDLCKEDVLCRGYTWKSNDIVGNYCYKFKNLNGIHGCEGCYSGTMPESLAGACAGSVDDILAQDTAENVEECSQFCYDTEGCNAFTWYDETTPFSKSCFLYALCDTLVSCFGCSTGRINCIPSLNQQCLNYFILSEDSRSNTFSYPVDLNLCDKSGVSNSSPMWRGPGYYRFEEPAGTRIPESPPGKHHCGTGAPGWLNGKHPTEVGLEVEMEACFDWDSEMCHRRTDITVTYCDGFYVYFLVEPSGCARRYCVSD